MTKGLCSPHTAWGHQGPLQPPGSPEKLCSHHRMSLVMGKWGHPVPSWNHRLYPELERTHKGSLSPSPDPVQDNTEISLVWAVGSGLCSIPYSHPLRPMQGCLHGQPSPKHH